MTIAEIILTTEPARYLIFGILATENKSNDRRKNPITLPKLLPRAKINNMIRYCAEAPGGYTCLSAKMLTSLRDYARNYYNSNRLAIEVT